MQTSAPSAPSDSSWKVYAKAGGIYARSSNAEVGPFGTGGGAGGTPTFVGVRAKRTTSQSINNASATAIQFDAEDFDTNTFHDTSSNNSRLTVPSGKDGYYLVAGTIQWANNTTGVRIISIKKNGSTQLVEAEYTPNFTSVDGPGIGVSCIVQLAATDYVELTVYQTSGGALNTRASAEGANFQMALLGT